ncbi:MAG: hypothetical protein HFJ74_05835 [Eggerthellaceae bacterium]|nr:hypothetical protein [Eggerthellaceae bacterium]
MRLNLKRTGSLAVVAALALCLTGCAKADEQTQAVIDRIDAIGEVTLGSKADIESIRKDYDKLPDDQVKFVENLDTLESAEAELGNLKVDQCIALVDEIGEVESASEKSVEEAWSVYDSLTSDERSRVTNSDKLKEAKKSVDAKAKAEREAAAEAKKSTSSSKSSSSSSSKKSSSTKEETGRYYDPKTGGTLYTYSDGTEEYTDGWGNAVRGKNGKADEYTTDGGETWHKYKD